MKRLCQVPQAPVRPVPATASPQRQNLIRLYEKKWVNGTTIRYHFLRDPQLAGTPQLEQTCRDAWQQWKDVGTGLNFQEVELPEESDVRIGFQRGDGRCGLRQALTDRSSCEVLRFARSRRW